MESFSLVTAIVVAGIALVTLSTVVPISKAEAEGYVSGESTVYSTYNGTAAPYPANNSAPIFPTAHGPAGDDDLMFQNLLGAEWVVFNFYQQGVEAFTASKFTDAGFKPTTYDRIAEIRDNEAGHVAIFEDSISSTSLKPGPCQYDYGFGTSAETYLVTQTVFEVVSMAFLTALSLQARLNATKGALVAIAEVEARHLTWGLIDVWNVDPFSGPVDTVYPYVNQILDVTKQFIIPGSCPEANPVYPNPRQNLPQLSNGGNVYVPGDNITFVFMNASHVPSFCSDGEYYAVFFHGVESISVPYHVETKSSVIPDVFANRGIIIAVIANEEGAPTEESVLAGPLFILLQPGGIALP
ncbi:unnamed protein product [Calypogeia fissa]